MAWRRLFKEENPMKFKTLQTLYAHELQEVYNLELQLAALLAEMDQVATDENLKRTFYDHSVETQQHLERLKEIFHNLNLDPEDYSSEIRQEWVAECREMADA